MLLVKYSSRETKLMQEGSEAGKESKYMEALSIIALLNANVPAAET